MIALQLKNKDFLFYLIKYISNAEPLNLQDKLGQTLIMKAVDLKRHDIIEELLDLNMIDLNKQDFVSIIKVLIIYKIR